MVEDDEHGDKSSLSYGLSADPRGSWVWAMATGTSLLVKHTAILSVTITSPVILSYSSFLGALFSSLFKRLKELNPIIGQF